MKSILITMAVTLLTVKGMSQPVKKTAKDNSQVPTQKEMQDLIRQAQSELDKMSPDDKKALDSLGVKLPAMGNAARAVSGISNQELALAASEKTGLPARNARLIGQIPKTIFSPAVLSSYTATLNKMIAGVIKPGAKEMADKIIHQYQTDPFKGALLAGAANGFWSTGYKEAAVYLMGEAIQALPNADNYNNYAACLTMMGAAHTAIPILNTLNNLYKNNSTILNNLGQAWLQLGDLDLAENYLDSTIRIYAFHPQANYTKCVILESKGKTAEAIAALERSLQHSVTPGKLRKLQQLQKDKYKKRGFYVKPAYYSASFNLSAYTALIPDEYAHTAGRDIQEKWSAFFEIIKEEKERVDQLQQVTRAKATEESARLMQNGLAQHGLVFAPQLWKAQAELADYTNSQSLSAGRQYSTEVEYLEQCAALKTSFDEALEKEKARFDKLVADGANVQDNCDGELPIVKNYLGAVNALHKKHNTEIVQQEMKHAYRLFNLATNAALTDNAALATVLNIKSGFLQRLLDLKHEYYDGITADCDKPVQYKPYNPDKLPDYDKVHCNYLDVINFPGMGTITIRCNTMGFTLNPILLPISGDLRANFDGFIEQASVAVSVKAVDIAVGATFDEEGKFVNATGKISTTQKIPGAMKQIFKGIDISASGEVDKNGFKKGSVDLGLKSSLGFIPDGLDAEGPVEIGLKNKLGVSLELDQGGIFDFYVKDKATMDVASNIEIDNKVETTPGSIDKFGTVTGPEHTELPLPEVPSVTISADNRWGINSGFSPAKGSLSGLSVSNK